MKLRDKLLVPIGVALIGIIGVSLGAMRVADRTWEQVESLRDRGQIELSAVLAAQVAFQRQSQEWKNVLLRGDSPEGLERHLRGFERREAEVQGNLATLVQRTSDPAIRGIAEDLQARHRRIGARYRAALGEKTAIGAAEADRIDAAVRRIDQQLSIDLDRLASQTAIQVDTDIVEAVQGSRRTAWLVLVVSIVLSGLIGAVLLGVLHRLVIRPAELADRLARAVAGDPDDAPDVASVLDAEILQDLPDDELGRLLGRLMDLRSTLEAERRASALTERELARARAEARSADEARSTFLATVSHELRTPLHGVLGTLQLLEDDSLDEEQRQLKNAAQESTERLASLVEDILDQTRISSGGDLALVDDAFDVASLLAAVIAELRPLAEAAGVHLSLAVAPGGPRRVRTDGGRLSRTVVELIRNALAANPAGQVEVVLTTAASAANVRVRIDVVDDGDGIPDELAEAIFQPFVQVHDTFDRTKQGAGLGLARCRRVARQLGGDLFHQPNPSGGSRFCLDLVVPQASEVDGLPAAALPGAGTATETGSHDLLEAGIAPALAASASGSLLCVGATSSRLGDVAGTSPTEVATLDEAVLALTRTAFDAVLVDVARIGIGSVHELRGVIDSVGLLTALVAVAPTSDRDRCLAEGWDDVLPDDADEPMVVEVVSRWMGSDLPDVVSRAS